MTSDTKDFGAGDEFNVPDFKQWDIGAFYSYADITADYEDLQVLNDQIAAARKALFRITDNINKNDRKASAAKTRYERAYRKAYIESQEKTETAKKIRAEIMVEDLENEYMYHNQLVIELNRAAYALRQELQALQGEGNNLRQQLKVV